MQTEQLQLTMAWRLSASASTSGVAAAAAVASEVVSGGRKARKRIAPQWQFPSCQVLGREGVDIAVIFMYLSCYVYERRVGYKIQNF